LTSKIERYEIESQLGEGGIGVVYKAVDPALNKVVAIKILSGSNLTADQQLRFQNEAKTLAELKHKSIPEVYNFSITENGAPYMVMEFISGRSLDSILSDHGKLRPHHAIDVAMQISEALKHAHSAGIIHRDVKPANVILSDASDSAVKLVDFGLAKLENSLHENQFQTKTGAIIGSPPYMSPEQLRSEKLDARTDIYALGCVLFEMLTGTSPFLGDNALETASKHLNDKIPFLPETIEPPDLRDELDSVIMRCLAKDRAERFESAKELTESLGIAHELSVVSLENKHDYDTTGSSSGQTINAKLVLTVIAAIGLVAAAVAWFTRSTALLQPPQTTGITPKSEHMMLTSGLNWLYKPEHRSVSGMEDTSDENFQELGDFKQLIEIDSEASAFVTGTGFKYVQNRPIETVKIRSAGLTSEGVSEMLKLPKLTNLTLGTAKMLPLSTFRQLRESRLKRLRFMSTPIPDRGFVLICSIPQLYYLNLGDRPKNAPKTDWSQLAKLRNTLGFLCIERYDFTNNDIKHLRELTRLSTLNLIDLGLNDDNFEILNLPNVERLSLEKNNITDKTLKKIASHFKSLEHLNIAGDSKVTKETVRWFEKTTGCKVTRSNISTGDTIEDRLRRNERSIPAL